MIFYEGKPVALAIDNGHGFHTFMNPKDGKHSPDKSLYEGDWTRWMVSLLIPELDALGFDCRLVVPELSDIGIRERARRANAMMAAEPWKKWFYLSVHINAAGNGGKWMTASGWSVFVAPNASQTARRLASSLYDAADGMGFRGNRSVPPERYWLGNYTVLTETKMPAVLTENLFQDNREEVEFLKSDDGKQRMVDIHVAGLCKFFGIPHTIITG